MAHTNISITAGFRIVLSFHRNFSVAIPVSFRYRWNPTLYQDHQSSAALVWRKLSLDEIVAFSSSGVLSNKSPPPGSTAWFLPLSFAQNPAFQRR
jgi:hypothetical protein